MNYEMKLIFSKKADMKLMAQEVMAICNDTGTTFLEQTGNTISYGSEEFERFAPSYIHLCFNEYMKPFYLDVIWSDYIEGTHSCKNSIVTPMQ